MESKGSCENTIIYTSHKCHQTVLFFLRYLYWVLYSLNITIATMSFNYRGACKLAPFNFSQLN